MGIQRTIQHPGVEIREIDKSQFAPAIEGTYCVVAGFADKGEEIQPFIVTSMSEFETLYGTPTNEAERYFYYASKEVVRNGGTLIAAKMPYNNVISKNYKAIGVTIDSGVTASSASTDSFVQDASGFYSGFHSVSATDATNIPTSAYDIIEAGGSFANAFQDPNTLSDEDFIIVSENKSRITGQNDNEGIFFAIVDPFDALNVQRMLPSADDDDAMDVILGINNGTTTWNAGSAFSNALTADFRRYSRSEDVMKQFPAIEFTDNGNNIDKTYSQYLGVVVCRTIADTQNEGKMDVAILEAFVGSIYNTDRNVSTGQSVYLGDIINAGSEHIRWYKNELAGLPTASTDNALQIDSKVYQLIGFTDAESLKIIQGQTLVNELRKTYEKLSNKDEIQVDVVIDAGLSTIADFTDDTAEGTLYTPETDVDADDAQKISSSSQVEYWRAICDEMISFCRDIRKDCMTILDVPRQLVLRGGQKWIRKTDPNKTFSNTINLSLRYCTGLNSSYAALYSNWLRGVDGITGKNFWMPQTVKVGGIYCYNDRVANIWDAPAGLNRGIINGVNDISYDPNSKAMDQLYIKSFNYAKFYPLDGYITEGQKTTQVKPSAFDRVNVRRLFLRLERLAYQVARYFVYEPNNLFTRRRLVDVLDPIFQRILNQGGMYDYRIVCDETNNTAEVIDHNELKVAILIKPVRTAEFILVDFIATRTDANFDEILEEVTG